MCNNMAESMETEQLLEKVQTEQSFPKALEVLDKGESFPKAPEQPIEPKVSDEGTKKTTAQADSARKTPSRHHRINDKVRCFA